MKQLNNPLKTSGTDATMRQPANPAGSNQLADALYTILEKEYRIHEQICLAAKDMNLALKAGQTPKVQLASAQYDTLVIQLEALEEERLAACDRLAGELGFSQRHGSVAQLIAQLPSECGNRLAGIRDSLKSKINEYASINVSNQTILEASLNTISMTFDIIRNNISSRTSGYKPYGTKERSTIHTSILNRTA